MSSDRGSPVAQWQALSSLYEQACDLDPDARRAMLDALARNEPTLHEGLCEMLAARDRADAGDFLGTLPRLAAPEPRALALPASREGTHIGPYRLERRLGAGGMAEVWLAERDDGAFRRSVAIKLPYARLAPGTDAAALARRFDRERDILASLRHPHIAGLIDAGVSDAGEAWLALEYVEGEPIGRYVDQRRASLRERVKLFRQVLLAVQHAHANLVIHRDLKPANILVTDAGEARLLDFGIAKLLEGRAADETELTRLGGAPLTPRYAAPEQLTGAPLTTACDVYALGVVFYELICGASPYETKVETVSAIERAIVEGEPRAPSRRVLSDEVAQARGTGPKALRRALAPELDAIALRCLAKTPAQRYSSVDALIADVDRWLGGEAVLARAPSPWARAFKFALRNKVGVGFGAAAVVALMATTVVAVRLGLDAQRESARAVAARDFMLELFKRADTEKARGADITARELLETGRRDVVTRLAGQPTLQAELLEGIGHIQIDMGEHATADSTWSDLVRVRAAIGDARGAALALAEQAFNAIKMSDFARAAPLLQRARQGAGPAAHDVELRAKLELVEGWLAIGEGRRERALQHFEASRDLAQGAFGPHDNRVHEALGGVVSAQRRLGRYEQALALHEQRRTAALGNPKLTPRDWAWLDSDGIEVEYAAGRFALVVQHAAEVVGRCDRALGPDNEACRRLLLKSAQARLRVGHEVPVAVRTRVESIAADRSSPYVQTEAVMVAFRLYAGGVSDGPWFESLRALGESGAEVTIGTPFKIVALALIAEAYLRRRDPAAASPWLDRALLVLAAGSTQPSAPVAYAKWLRGIEWLQRDRVDVAITWLTAAQRDFAAALGATHPQTRQCEINIALALHRQGRAAEALALWNAAEPALREAFGVDSPAYARIVALRPGTAAADGALGHEPQYLL